MIEPAPPRAAEPMSASWARRLLDCIRSLRVLAGPGLLARRTPAGTVLSLASAPLLRGARGGGEAVPAIVTSAANGVYDVDLYGNGIGMPSTGTATLSIPEVSMLATLPVGCIVLAHSVPVPVAEAEEDPADGEEEES